MATVTLVNCFEIPAGRDSLAPDARSRFVNVAEWASAQDFHAAHDEGFCALVNQPSWAEFHHFPALYEVIHEGQAAARTRER